MLTPICPSISDATDETGNDLDAPLYGPVSVSASAPLFRLAGNWRNLKRTNKTRLSR